MNVLVPVLLALAPAAVRAAGEGPDGGGSLYEKIYPIK
jgi:hypothetical protein